MKALNLYAKIVSPHEVHKSWCLKPPNEIGWYPIEREPETNEYLEYDETEDRIVIKKRQKTAEQIEIEHNRKIKHQFQAELSELILANKDNPENLAKVLCDRAKQIETETKT